MNIYLMSLISIVLGCNSASASYWGPGQPDSCEDLDGFVAPVGGQSIRGYSNLNLVRDLDQGSGDTCYLHVTKQMLEHYHDPALDFSFLSLIEGCSRDPSRSGNISAVLHNLRLKKPEIQLYCGDDSKYQISEITQSRLPEARGTERPETPPAALLDYNYNIHIYEAYRKSATAIQAQLDQIFDETQRPFGVSLEGHTVLLVGSGMVCCGHHHCKKRLLISNSARSTRSGWYDAKNFLKRLANDPLGRFVYLKKCDPAIEDVRHPDFCYPDQILSQFPLHDLVKANDVKGIAQLLKKEGKVDRLRQDKATPALVASGLDHVEALKVLFENGANLNQAGKDGVTPVLLAAREGSFKTLVFLADHGADLNHKLKSGRNAVHLASFAGHVDILKFLFEKHLDLNAGDLEGSTPAHFAAESGHVEVLKFLLEKGADLNRPRKDGWTPAHFAASAGRIEVLQFLASQGVDLDPVGQDGETPTSIAVQKNRLEVLKFLVAHGVNLNREGAGGMTPVHRAAELFCGLNSLKLLAEKGADLNRPRRDGMTPVFLAVESGNLPVLTFLIQMRVDLNHPRKDGMTPAYYAEKHKNKAALMLLSAHGAIKKGPSSLWKRLTQSQK